MILYGLDLVIVDTIVLWSTIIVPQYGTDEERFFAKNLPKAKTEPDKRSDQSAVEAQRLKAYATLRMILA